MDAVSCTLCSGFSNRGSTAGALKAHAHSMFFRSSIAGRVCEAHRPRVLAGLILACSIVLRRGGRQEGSSVVAEGPGDRFRIPHQDVQG